MTWEVKYLPEVQADLAKLDRASVKRVEKVIQERIIDGSPDKTGNPLRNNLASCRRIRIGDIRIVYKVFKKEIQVLVIAVGMRRNNEIYDTAESRNPRQLSAPKKSVKKKARRKSKVRVVK